MVEKKKKENLNSLIRKVCASELSEGERYIMITISTMDDEEIPAIYYEL